MLRQLPSTALALLLTGSLVALSFAQADEPGSADDVASEMMNEMQPSDAEAAAEPPVDDEVITDSETEGTNRPSPAPTPTAVEARDAMGVAPDLQRTGLRREGEFVVNRRGRLVRVAGSPFPVFAFDADSASSPDPPMTLMPSQLLEEMQATLEEDRSAVFIVTGQVFTYQGRNYLLPTMSRQARQNEL